MPSLFVRDNQLFFWQTCGYWHVLKVKAISIVMNITNQPICLQQMFHSNYTPPLYPSVKAHLYVLNICLALFVNILSLLFNPLPSPPPPPPPSITFLMVRPYGRWFQKIEPAVSSSCFVYIYILGICVFYSYPQVKVAKPSVTDEKLNIISLD